MKEILAAIDFSECSVNAAEHAAGIAQRAGANLKLVYIYNPEHKYKTIYKYKDPLDEATHLLEELTQRFQLVMPHGEVSFKIREGKVFREVADEAKESKAMMIVAGTHGASGFEELWIGSNAFRIISAAPCPVITLREGVKPEKQMRRIILPIDATLSTRQKVPYATMMAKLFNAEIHVLALYQSGIKDAQQVVLEYAKQTCAYLEKNHIDFLMTSRRCKNPTDSTIDYAIKVDANLIVIMTEQTSSPLNIIMGPYAQQMIHRSPIPVMSVQPKEFLRILTR
ncbi:MAG: universal stress protein [Bacteroidales bacterium]